MNAAEDGEGSSLPAPTSTAEHDSIDQALSAVGVGAHQLGLFLYVGGCWMSDAMEVMLVAVLAPAVACEWDVSPEGQSMLASAVFTGMMLASSAWGAVADLAGRKAAFGAAAGLAAGAGLASAFAPTFMWLVALRLLVGCGLVGVLPMFTLLEEWIPMDSGRKGKFLVALQAWWSVGTIVEALLALWLLDAWGWRVLLAASSVPLACILAALPLIPESPQYLAGAGRTAEAHSVLALAAARNGTTARLKRHLELEKAPRRAGGQEVGGNASGGGGAAGTGTVEVHLELEAAVSRDGTASPGLCKHCRVDQCLGCGARAVGWCGELAALGRVMLGPQLVGRTWRLAITWFACALSYYGVVMLVPFVAAGGGLHAGAAGIGAAAAGSGPGAGSCIPWPGGGGSHLVLPSRAYLSMMAASAAELPSLAWAFLAVDRWSTRRVVSLSLAATAAALAPLVMARAAAASNMPALPAPDAGAIVAAGGSAAATAATAMRRRLNPAWLMSPASWWLPLASVTMARLFVTGAFSLLYVLTPTQYPPRVHGSALGAANTLARVGALAAPFVAVALPQRGALPQALGLMAAACGVAALAVGSLPGEAQEL